MRASQIRVGLPGTIACTLVAKGHEKDVSPTDEGQPQARAERRITARKSKSEEMINELLAAFEQFRAIDGFIEGGVLANGDDTKVASYVRARSAADRERGAEHEEVRERMSALAAIDSSHADAYERMWVIAPPRHIGPVQASRGAF